MKNQSFRGKVYQKLLWKLFFQTVVVLGASFLLTLGTYAAVRGRFADFLVNAISYLLSLNWDSARDIYQHVIRNNITLVFGVTFIVYFLILMRILMPWFTRFFDRIVSGIDHLAEEVDAPIRMGTELKFMEVKLNEVKQRLKQRTETAKREEQRKNDLVVYLAHDIRTPLTSVIGYLSLLDEASDMPAEQRAKYTHITLEKANRLEKLINELFEITRYNSQQGNLEKVSIDLYYMLVQMVDEFYPILTERGNSAVLEVDETLTVSGDSAKLARVFNNILKNAAAYSDPGTPIIIAAKNAGAFVLISFQNQGPIIPADKLSAIFEKFFRLDEARASDTGGSGLGLSIAKEIVTLHGGTIQAESKAHSTTFTVSLPA
ncbi:MAG: HAMP domain-containing sensor histidine kinase [Eubacteriales bacterium]|nr:HAMP domain-containing sensor histidine kinase [Eubacteriales bacterium]